MNNDTFAVIYVGGFLAFMLFAAFKVWQIKRKHYQRRRSIQDFCRLQGWIFESGPAERIWLRVQGQNSGIPWTYEEHVDQHGERVTTIWTASLPVQYIGFTLRKFGFFDRLTSSSTVKWLAKKWVRHEMKKAGAEQHKELSPHAAEVMVETFSTEVRLLPLRLPELDEWGVQFFLIKERIMRCLFNDEREAEFLTILQQCSSGDKLFDNVEFHLSKESKMRLEAALPDVECFETFINFCVGLACSAVKIEQEEMDNMIDIKKIMSVVEKLAPEEAKSILAEMPGELRQLMH